MPPAGCNAAEGRIIRLDLYPAGWSLKLAYSEQVEIIKPHAPPPRAQAMLCAAENLVVSRYQSDCAQRKQPWRMKSFRAELVCVDIAGRSGSFRASFRGSSPENADKIAELESQLPARVGRHESLNDPPTARHGSSFNCETSRSSSLNRI